ncbi:MlaD family protein [Marinoscillum sp. MHG1-6]|uniref:MlaD family protein n=1 Tax=Marinoscillum sp. MHG1-6 TaxID=2959627 RepID=UPI002157FDDA|nr:MlaD family protein [Marinoscillum sp. MHG1-6]
MSKQFKVGLIALLAGGVLYWGFNFLKGTDFFSPINKYYVVYENVEGLNKSNPVIINGLTVGRVSEVSLLQEKDNFILVELDIDESVVLGSDAQAALSNTDFLGSKGIVLNVGNLSNPAEPGDTLDAVIDKGLGEILESAQPVANNLNTTITRVNEILIGLKGSGEKINETIGELQKMIVGVNYMIDKNQSNIAKVIASTSEVVNSLNDKIDQLGPVISKSEGLIDTLSNVKINQTLAGMDSLIYNLNQTVMNLKDSEGTLGKFIKDDSVYNNLNQLLIDLDKLAIHFDQYPKDFMKPLGRKHKKLKSGNE